MQREDLEHIIRAAAALTKENDFIIIGSQAILGQYPDAPQALRVSMKADIYPRDRPELADQIDGSLGMDSPFDATFGYHADGVSPGTATYRATPSREGAGVPFVLRSDGPPVRSRGRLAGYVVASPDSRARPTA